MEQLRTWGVSLCFATAACVLLQFLAPKTATGRLFDMLCGAVLLFCVISPLVKVKWGEVLSFDFSDVSSLQSENMQVYLHAQLQGPLQEAVHTEGMAALKVYGLSAERITATMDIDENGNICIDEVIVYLNEQQAPQKMSVQKILEQRFQTTVVVKEE